MGRRLIAALVATVLAAVGAVLLTGYVAGADQRAMTGLAPTAVLVVTAEVPQGTAAADLGDAVTTRELPATAVAPGALTALDEVAGLVTTADLLPGEQLLPARFADPAELTRTDVEVPAGLQELTVQLDAQRVVGGHLRAGDTVGVFISLAEEQRTQLTLHRVLVTRVQGGVTESADGDEGAPDGAAAAPAGSLLVTLALSAADAERVVFAAEFDRIWLSREPEGAATGGTRVVTPENVLP